MKNANVSACKKSTTDWMFCQVISMSSNVGMKLKVDSTAAPKDNSNMAVKMSTMMTHTITQKNYFIFLTFFTKSLVRFSRK